MLVPMETHSTSDFPGDVLTHFDWKPPKELKCPYTQPIPHINKKLSSLIALNLFQIVTVLFFIGILEKRKCIHIYNIIALSG